MPEIDMQKFVRECRTFKDVLVKEDADQDLINSCIELIHDATEPLMLMVMGEFSTGKSTFINALLGQEVTVVNATPTTAVITKLCYGQKEQLLIHYKDGHIEEVELAQFKKMTAESGEEAQKLHARISYVERCMPMEMLQNLTIIDSPGLNALVEQHAQATNSFIGKADVVFWMFTADQPVSHSEIEAMGRLDSRFKPVAIMNKMDNLDPEEDDPEEFLQENYDKVKDRVQTMFGISAKQAFEGQQDDDEEMEQESGLETVREFIRDNIMPNRDEYKRNTLFDDLIDMSDHLYQSQRPIKELLNGLKDEDYDSYLAEQTHLMTVSNQFLAVADPFYQYLMSHTSKNSTEKTFQGLLFIYGYMGEKNLDKAIALLEDAAMMGDVKGQVFLSRALIAKKDYKKAFHWAEKASKENNPKAENLLARMYAEGIGTTKDAEKSQIYYQKSAKQGDPDAMLALAKYYHEKKDTDKANQWLERAAIAGQAEAMYNWSINDACKDENWQMMLIQSARKGYPKAKVRLGNYFTQNDKQDTAIGIRLIRQAALQGNAEAQNELGLFYDEGRYGVPQNVQKAERWYRRAVAQNDNTAKRNLAIFLLEKKGDKRYREEIVKLLQEVIESGDDKTKNILYQVAIKYQAGESVAKDEPFAHQIFVWLANKGMPDAMNQAGLTANDEAEESTWFKKAAEARNPWGYYNLGTIAEDYHKYTKAKEYYLAAVNMDSNLSSVEKVRSLSYYQLGCLYADGKLGKHWVNLDKENDRRNTALYYLQKAKDNKEAEAKINQIKQEIAEIKQKEEEKRKREEERERQRQLEEKRRKEEAERRRQAYLKHLAEVKDVNSEPNPDWIEEYKKGAEQNDPQSLYAMGCFVADGQGGLKKDLPSAQAYLKLAEKYGHPRAKQKLIKVKRQIFKRKASKIIRGVIFVAVILGVVIGGVKNHNFEDWWKSVWISDTKGNSAETKNNGTGTAATREMQTDLSLGGLDIDCTDKDMVNLYGKEDSEKTVNGLVRHKYNGKIEVVTEGNRITALVSDGPNVKTKRGLHEGSTFAEMKKAYGTGYMKSDYNDVILYEYTFSSMKGDSGILRFAVNKSDNTVKYISVRLDRNNTSSNNKASTAKNATQLSQMRVGKPTDNITRLVFDSQGMVQEPNISIVNSHCLTIDVPNAQVAEEEQKNISNNFIKNVTTKQLDNNTVRVTINTNIKAEYDNYRVFGLNNPDRLVIDIGPNVKAEVVSDTAKFR